MDSSILTTKLSVLSSSSSSSSPQLPSVLSSSPQLPSVSRPYNRTSFIKHDYTKCSLYDDNNNNNKPNQRKIKFVPTNELSALKYRENQIIYHMKKKYHEHREKCLQVKDDYLNHKLIFADYVVKIVELKFIYTKEEINQIQELEEIREKIKNYIK